MTLAAFIAAAFIAASLATPVADAYGQAMRRPAPPSAPADAEPSRRAAPPQDSAFAPLPPDRTTRHMLRIGGGELAFDATAGAIPLFDAASGRRIAVVSFIAFRLADADAGRRPVVFAFNGGPGYASAWLNLGALGPWRLNMDGEAISPSAPPTLVDNAESWLPFADLVFLDPPGTGYSRIDSDETRRSLWSVDGDIAALSTAIRRWTETNNRMLSPKYIVGESYGGFRAPKIAHRLQVDDGVGVAGLVMVSPVLDFGGVRVNEVLSAVARLPTLAAIAASNRGSVSPADLAAVEAYARGPYLADLMRGFGDGEALDRISEQVARLTGLDRALVRQYGGRVPAMVFLRESQRAQGRFGSIYDGSVTSADPFPYSRRMDVEDPIRLGLHAPITSAMMDIYRNRLNWTPADGRYYFKNDEASDKWNWGRRPPQAREDLQRAFALDARLRALIAHGINDLATPYFETRLTLDQTPLPGDPSRVTLRLYEGGHMFYARAASRAAFAADARRLIEAR